MRSKNGTTTTTKMLFVFVIFLGASFTASVTTVGLDSETLSVSEQTAATAAGEDPVTRAAGSVTSSAADQTNWSAAGGGDSVTGEAQATTDGAGQTPEPVTSNQDDGSQSTQGQTIPGAQLGASIATQGTAAEETTGISTERAASDVTSNNAGLVETTAAAEETTTGAAGATIAVSGATTAAAGTTAAAEGTTAEASHVVFKKHSTETSRVDVSVDRTSGRQTTADPNVTSMKSSESTEASKTSIETENIPPIKSRHKNQLQSDSNGNIGQNILNIVVAIALLSLLILSVIGIVKMCGKSAPSTDKGGIMLEEGSPGEPGGTSNPISDAEIVGGEGPVPGVAAAATPNGGGGGQPISNPNDEGSWVVPIEDMENTKL